MLQSIAMVTRYCGHYRLAGTDKRCAFHCLSAYQHSVDPSSCRCCTGEKESKIGVAASTSLLIGLLVSLAEVRTLHMPAIADTAQQSASGSTIYMRNAGD